MYSLNHPLLIYSFILILILVLFIYFIFSYTIERRSCQIQKDQGFTLVELIVTVCVLAIIAIIAAPSILTQLANMESKRIRYDISSMLATAKAESYLRRQNLIVCLSDSAGRCHKNSNKAMLLFFDHNDNQHFDTSTDELLEQQRLSPRYAQLHLRAGNRHYIKFWGDSARPRGFFGHIKYCPTSSYNQSKYQISFNQGGIVKYKPDAAHPTGC
ncbi:GspH/FimT family pseudopilin [Psychrobacter submarinus]|uniref:GspH/FimT family pseudopilin n=1 Tax=Psychrobacter submarinus TaxID=154108 RepID=UPI003F6A3188